jgi:hypothetical protein
MTTPSAKNSSMAIATRPLDEHAVILPAAAASWREIICIGIFVITKTSGRSSLVSSLVPLAEEERLRDSRLAR